VTSPIFCPAWAIACIEYPENAAINESMAVISPSTLYRVPVWEIGIAAHFRNAAHYRKKRTSVVVW
jgi:hypothetical protein